MSLLLGLLLPITGLIFCCCRCCCGRCGGRRMDPAKLYNLRGHRGLVMAGCLLLVNLVMITAALCMYPANSRISSSFEVTVQTADNIVDDLLTFLNKTFQEVDLFVDQDVGVVLDAVSSDISGVGTLAAGPFITAMESRIDTFANSLATVDTELDSAHASVISLNNSLTLMKELFSTLEAGINQAKDNLTSIRTDCDADGTLSGLGACDGIPDLSSQAATLAALNARDALNSISAEIENSTDISVDFSVMHEPLKNMVTNLTSGVQEFLNEDKLKDMYMHHVTYVTSLLEQYEGARSVTWYFMFSLVICLLSTVLVLVGMNMSVVCDSVLDLTLFDKIHTIMDSVSPLNASTQADQAADAIQPHDAASFGVSITSVNESINAVQTNVAGSISAVDALSNLVQDSAMTLLTQGIDDVVSRLTGYGTQLVDEGVRRVQEDVGRCQILSNIFDAVVGVICVYFGEGLNSLWLSFAIVVACLVPSIVLSVRLGKYYRRVLHPAEEEAIRPGSGALTSQYAADPGADW
uniref:Prominin-1-A-like n=1 Tax=Branchiostoma floridae TaxID=7739 RepID=C3Y3N7_BRAFL|eukprot:XP_002608903.1 hypothetical protein BRAFLDRAFT_85538 [Branchiostoma floridae]